MASTSATTWTGKSEKSERDHFFYWSGKEPSAVRYKNWKMYTAMVSQPPSGFVTGASPSLDPGRQHQARPFETSIGEFTKTLMGVGGALAGPVTAYQYDWNMLPIAQALWLKEVQTSTTSRRCRARQATIWTQVMEQVREMQPPVTPANSSPGADG